MPPVLEIRGGTRPRSGSPPALRAYLSGGERLRAAASQTSAQVRLRGARVLRAAAGRAALTALLGLMAIGSAGCLSDGASFDALDEPVAFTLRVHGRDLDLASTAGQAPALYRLTGALFVPGLDETRRAAVRDYRRLITWIQGEEAGPGRSALAPVQARLAILLAESGDWPAAMAALDALPAMTPEAPAFRRVLLAVHDRGPPAPPTDLARALAVLGAAGLPDPALLDGWPGDCLSARFYQRAGQLEAARQMEGRIQARGLAAWRDAGLAALPNLVVILGLLLALGHLLRRRPLPVVGEGLARAPWTLGHGLLLLLRSVLVGLLLLTVAVLLEKATGRRFLGLHTLLVALPMVYWTRIDLRAAGLSLVAAFGLRPAAPTRSWLAVTVLLVGVEQALAIAVSVLARAAGFVTEPSESVLEAAALGSPIAALLTALDVVVWAPLFEEIAFRGLLYTTLRTALRPWPAALLSALTFAAVHGYSVPAALGLFIPAVAAALIYERTRTLLPMILAHAFNNTMAVLASLLVYR